MGSWEWIWGQRYGVWGCDLGQEAGFVHLGAVFGVLVVGFGTLGVDLGPWE